jgi:hypothetical protein
MYAHTLKLLVEKNDFNKNNWYVRYGSDGCPNEQDKLLFHQNWDETTEK